MSRHPNDDRSDSKNPNNSAYWASQSNHRNQTGGDDDYDDGGFSPPRTFGLAEQAKRSPAPKPSPIEVFVTSPVRTCVHGLYLLCISDNATREQRIIVDSPTIDEAVSDAQALWEGGGWSYLALYEEGKEGGKVHLECRSDALVPDSLVEQVCTLGALNKLVRMADAGVANARRALESSTGNESRQSVLAAIKEFGACKAARDGLHGELTDKLTALAARGLHLSEQSLDEAVASASRGRLASQSAERIRAPQRGYTSADLLIAVAGAQKIASLRRA